MEDIEHMCVVGFKLTWQHGGHRTYVRCRIQVDVAAWRT